MQSKSTSVKVHQNFSLKMTKEVDTGDRARCKPVPESDDSDSCSGLGVLGCSSYRRLDKGDCLRKRTKNL